MTDTMDEPIRADVEVNALGLRCPLPLLRLKAALAKMTTGQVVVVRASDPQFRRDVEVFSRYSHAAILSSTQEEQALVYWIRKAQGSSAT